MVEIFKAIVLGVIEGLTEFLPISSTGHIIVGADAIGYKDSAEIFTVVVQVGAVLAVIWYYRYDLFSKFKALLSKDPIAVRFLKNIIIATLPVALFGLLFEDVFDLIAVALTVGITLILGGVAIWIIETYHKAPLAPKSGDKIDKLTFKQSLSVGLYQIIALVPGVSRAGATIMGGLLSGVDRVTATAFSFYLAIPIILLAGGYQLIDKSEQIDTVSGGYPALITGTVVAFFVALLTIKWLLKYVAKNDFKIFAYYRIIAGLIVLGAVFFAV